MRVVAVLTESAVRVELSLEEVVMLRSILMERAPLGASQPTEQWVNETRLWAALERLEFDMKAKSALNALESLRTQMTTNAPLTT